MWFYQNVRGKPPQGASAKKTMNFLHTCFSCINFSHEKTWHFFSKNFCHRWHQKVSQKSVPIFFKKKCPPPLVRSFLAKNSNTVWFYQNVRGKPPQGASAKKQQTCIFYTHVFHVSIFFHMKKLEIFFQKIFVIDDIKKCYKKAYQFFKKKRPPKAPYQGLFGKK